MSGLFSPFCLRKWRRVEVARLWGKPCPEWRLTFSPTAHLCSDQCGINQYFLSPSAFLTQFARSTISRICPLSPSLDGLSGLLDSLIDHATLPALLLRPGDPLLCVHPVRVLCLGSRVGGGCRCCALLQLSNGKKNLIDDPLRLVFERGGLERAVTADQHRRVLDLENPVWTREQRKHLSPSNQRPRSVILARPLSRVQAAEDIAGFLVTQIPLPGFFFFFAFPVLQIHPLQPSRLDVKDTLTLNRLRSRTGAGD